MSEDFARKNYRLAVLNGILFNVGETFMDTATVLTLFVSRLTDRAWIVGFAGSLTDLGWYLPQILTIHFLEGRRQRLPVYRAMACVRVLGMFGVLASVLVFGERRPTATLWGALGSFALYAVAGGFGAVAFYDVVGRTVPLSRQPRMWAMRLFYGGILSAAVGAFIPQLLGLPSFTARFGWLFGLAAFFVLLGAFTFAQAAEPPVAVSKKELHLAAHLRTNLRVAWRDPAFRALFGTRVALAGAFLATPFYALFAVRQLGFPASSVGGFLVAKIVGYVGANLVWQRVAAGHGSRALMALVGVASAAAPLLALLGLVLPAAGPWRPLAMGTAFALVGATVSGTNIGYQSLLLAIAPVARRPSYVGLMNSFVGPAMLLPALGGWVADATRPEIVFALSFVAALAAIGLAARLPGGRMSDVVTGPDREGEAG
jgi:hypothetical protein